MTREEIIKLAVESGFHFQTFRQHAPIQHTVESAYSEKCFERLANRVLEEAAKKCEANAIEPQVIVSHKITDSTRKIHSIECAEAIRSMKV